MLSRSFLLTLASVFLPVVILSANPSNPPAGKTGAPGEGRCAECHTGTPDNPGLVVIDFGKLTYTPGQKQRLGVHVLHTRTAGFTGFQVTARLASDERLQAGSFEAATPSAVQVANGVQYVNQNTNTSNEIFVFDWTPPATNLGNVKFYVQAVAGEGNGHPDANVYSAVYSYPPAVTADTPSGYRTTSIRVPDALETTATGISNDGKVTGYYRTATRILGFIRDTAGGLTTVDIPNAVSIYPSGINDAGTIVGTYIDAADRRTAFIRASGAVSTIEIPGATSVTPGDIDNSGQVVGSFLDSNSVSHAFVWRSNTAFNFFDIGSSTRATGISQTGLIAGSFNRSAYVKQPDGSIEGTSMCEATGSRGISFALKINDAGTIAGLCEFASVTGVFRSNFVIWPSGRRWDALDSPSGINNNGQIVARGLDGASLLLTPCAATTASTSTSLPATETSFLISATTDSPDCSPLALQSADGLSSAANPNQRGSGDYAFNIRANTSTTARTSTLYFAGRLITITQAGAACDFALSGTQSTFSNLPGNGQLLVTTLPGCLWVASSSVNWISFPEGTSGTQTGTLRFTIAANSTSVARSGVINVANRSFTVLQAASSPLCTFSAGPTQVTAPADGGTFIAAVVTQTGCPWSVVGGSAFVSIVGASSGLASGNVTFSISPNPMAAIRTATFEIAGSFITIIQNGATTVPTGLRFVPVSPCRVADTRATEGKTGAFGPPSLLNGETREIPIPSSTCAIPSNARAYALNVTVVPRVALSYLTTWPTGTARPVVSTLNSFDGRVVANAAVVPAGVNGSINVFATDTTDVILDINGYFVTSDIPIGLAFYPVTPCRVADTRPEGGKAGSFGPPRMAGGETRTLSPTASGCGIPAEAQAYSLNITAVPQGPLPYLSVWRGGLPQPVVSTLNSFNGQVVPNAAIVPAGANGAISLYAAAATDVIIDINGYFAPPGGPNALSFYATPPCRVADTRPEGGLLTPFGPSFIAVRTTRDFPIPISACGIPPSAKAYALNVTAVPFGYLGFVTVWPSAAPQPFVSTLNSWNGQVVANAALVPASLTGAVSVYVSNDTHIILDINGYFAQ